MMRRLTVAAAITAAMLLPALASAQKKGEKIKVKKGQKVQAFNDSVKIVRPDDKAWKVIHPRILGAKLEHGVMILRFTNWWERKPKTKLTLTLNGKQMDALNTGKIAKELQNMYEGQYKKVLKSTKPKKLKIKAGKMVYFDMLVQGGKSKEGSEMLNQFTTDAAGMDATRSFNPREIKMYVRQFVGMGKGGTCLFHISATEEFFKKHKKDINKVLKSMRIY